MTHPSLELPEMPAIEPDAAPKRGRGRPRGSGDKTPRQPRTSARKPSVASLEKRLAGSLTTLGTVVCLASPPDGMVVVNGVPALAAALAKLAEENPSVRENLERMLTAGAWSGVIAAVLPIVLGICANHGMIPAQLGALIGAGVPTAPGDANSSVPFGAADA